MPTADLKAELVCFEDLPKGTVIDLGSYEVTEDDIVDFGKRWDPQVFHIDPVAAVDSPFGGLIASGWHTVSIWCRLWIDTVMLNADSRGSPGMEQIRWWRPVRPGDVLRGSVEILDAWPSGRDPTRGTVVMGCEMRNQNDEVVMTTRGRGMLGRREPEAPPSDRSATAATDSRNGGAGTSGGVATRTVRTSDGVDVKLHHLGGEGPDLLISHATGFCGLAYEPMVRKLGERFTVWTLDHRGHGASAASPDGDYNWGNMTLDVAACVAEIGSPRLYALGHSMGAAVLLGLERDRPGTFAGLFLYEPIVLPAGWVERRGGNPLTDGARRRRASFASRAEVLSRFSRRPPLNVLRADALAAYVTHGFNDMPNGTVRIACEPETEARTYEGSTYLALENVGEVNVAVVVAAGEEVSEPDPAQFAPTLADSLTHGRFVRFHNLGHLGPLEAPDLVAARVAQELLAPAEPQHR